MTKRRKSKISALREDPPPYHVNGNGSHNKLRFIDLFCGIGGFRFAFERAGCECVFSSDWNEKAQETYAANFGERPHGDIHSVAVGEIPEHDILCAGFPCQPFSIAGVSKKLSLGKKHGFEDKEQGNLFFDIEAIINFHQPAAFVLENVKNLRGHDQGRTFQIIYDTLTKALGYTVYYKVIDAQSLVPQHRERIFLVGFKERRGFEFPKFPAEGPKLESILEAEVPEKYTLTDHLWKYLQDYAAKHKAAGNGFGFGLVTGKDTTRTLSARYYKDGSEILISQGPRKNPRRLTPRECARLMGYDRKFIGRDFIIPVSDTQAYKQFGNSVVVPVVERIAKAVLATLRQPADFRPDLVLAMSDRANVDAAKRTAVQVSYRKAKAKQKA
jgi:DNA (cytosine-5)-methyltransferase 1